MRFFIVEDYLLEDKAAVLAHYPDIPSEEAEFILSMDPTYRPDSNSVGTYGKWLLNLYKKGQLNLHADTMTRELLSEFDSNKRYLDASQRDINKYKNLEELDQVMLNFEGPELTDRQKLRQRQKAVRNTDVEKDAEKVFEDSDWTIYVPKTVEASCKLGQGTEWCTATTSNDNMFDRYNHQGPLYILIYKKNPKEKYQFHFETESFMDAEDLPINFISFVTEYPSVYKFFSPQIQKMVSLSEDNNYHIRFDEIEVRRFSDGLISALLTGEEVFNPSDFFSDRLNSDLLSYLDEPTERLFAANGYSKERLSELLDEDIDDDNDETDVIIYNIFRRADAIAQQVGAETDARDDLYRAIDRIADLYNIEIEIDREDDTLTINAIPEEALNISSKFIEETESYDARDNLSYLLSVELDNYFREPQYGWSGFDEQVFNDVIQMDILDETNFEEPDSEE